ncbi:Endonuclease/exonuclease/phosphatase [Corchorus olitorius]|uniref:Endonuclease/exonuclease/phosphatase n=1 Tax=Corchorus olitorius TaxID=93759 RepID=A0A1R3INH3_9ROSI|nr:Endonuclease/exonuclease/phosphatase [Corchorus olitorius]
MGKGILAGEEWIILGDFNQVLSPEDKISDTSCSLSGADEFRSCLDKCKVTEVTNKGIHFTWSNRREKGQCTWERLDRAFANAEWFQTFGNAVSTNLPISVSDHSPLWVQFERRDTFRKRPYRFEMMWTTNPQCEEIIRKSWNQVVSGSAAYKVVQKVKFARDELKNWNRNVFGNIFQKKI